LPLRPALPPLRFFLARLFFLAEVEALSPEPLATRRDEGGRRLLQPRSGRSG